MSQLTLAYPEDALDGCFSTRLAAVQELKERLTAAITARKTDIANLKSALAELVVGPADV